MCLLCDLIWHLHGHGYVIILTCEMLTGCNGYYCYILLKIHGLSF